MSRLGDTSSEARFASFLTALAGVVGHADRAVPLRDYCTGLLMPAERKSVEPMAAVTAPHASPPSTSLFCTSLASPPGRMRWCSPRFAS
jgi:SRSO17 transposase